ncbi:MAG: zinc-dependent alcohol dehydrogenase family protein [Verrucomicrobia bacterium]|nr:zinc-dependent alcohol dehydrogenase family protein [Verrucomicrobiota bacterium]
MLVRHDLVSPSGAVNNIAKMIRFHQIGRSDVLKVEDTPFRRPDAGEVLVKMHALGLSRIDVLWREGSYFEQPVFPAGIGYDAAGIIESVGSGVHQLKIGDRVSTLPAVSLVDYPAHGESAIYPENGLFLYPQNLSAGQAASVNLGLFTAYFALGELARMAPDQFVVITAASSSMGMAAIQLAKSLGTRCIAVTRSEGKRTRLLQAGADHVVVAGADDVQEMVLEITDGEGADVVYDGVAGPGLEELIWATRRRGFVIVYGYLGAMDATTRLPLGACFLRGINLYPSFKVFDYTGNPKLGICGNSAAVERAKSFISAGLASGVLKPTIDRVFDGLSEYTAAHQYLNANTRTGKVVVSLG